MLISGCTGNLPLSIFKLLLLLLLFQIIIIIIKITSENDCM